jgi:16S rRNA (uracil1498-N3)-methyltransferase
MHIFYTPDISGKSYLLNEDESKHCIRVLRLKLGAEVCLVDGKGGIYNARISADNPKACWLDIIDEAQNFGKKDYWLHLAVAPTKNTDRLEWMIEKAVEIGIDEFTPIICEHSERKNLNIDRLERIAVSAMKQSLKAYKPQINECQNFNKFIPTIQTTSKLIAHCIPEITTENKATESANSIVLLKHEFKNIYIKGQSVTCLIGPEGDFSTAEVILAQNAGFKGVSLGSSRLRTETAGLVACHSIYFMNQ